MTRQSFVLAGLMLSIPLAFDAGGPAAFAQSVGSSLKWEPCGDVPSTECAGLQVPIDCTKPDGAKITLRIGRAPAVDPAKRKGVLLMLPGGPGAGIPETIGNE